eukprot:scaffold438_cov250-Pinguiococcus_pyrenoidosus.AAC.15
MGEARVRAVRGGIRPGQGIENMSPRASPFLTTCTVHLHSQLDPPPRRLKRPQPDTSSSSFGLSSSLATHPETTSATSAAGLLSECLPRRCDARGQNDGHDEAIDTEHTRHDDRDDVAHDQIRLHNPQSCDADAGLRRSVSCADVREHQRARDAQETEQRGPRGAVFHRGALHRSSPRARVEAKARRSCDFGREKQKMKRY